ncbi:MAG: DUF1365 domain-containing protein [bacterium]
MKSAFYEGTVTHARSTEVDHNFSVSLFMVYLDLGDLNDVFSNIPCWTINRPGLAAFHRNDHFGETSRDLEDCVRDKVEEKTGERPTGSIRLLTQLRYFGYCFNPVSFYYCFNRDEDDLEAVLAEVHNTPWGEEHVYVLPRSSGDSRGGRLSFTFDKEFHVSPFLSMDTYYDLSVTVPNDSLSVRIDSYRDNERILRADLHLKRRSISMYSAFVELMQYPGMTLQTIGRIYYEALKLWWKGASYHPHPRGAST